MAVQLVNETWGPDKRKLTQREIVAMLIEQSQCVVSAYPAAEWTPAGCPSRVEIEFHGSLGAIPNLKDMFVPTKTGRPIPRPSVMAHVQAMDIMFSAERDRQGLPSNLCFGTNPVFMTLICGRRPVSFDLVGVVQTVQDWLEPSSKQVGGRNNKHNRGWGVGLVEDDKYITPFPLHAWQVEREVDYTRIILEPWDTVEFFVQDFALTILCNGMAKMTKE